MEEHSSATVRPAAPLSAPAAGGVPGPDGRHDVEDCRHRDPRGPHAAGGAPHHRLAGLGWGLLGVVAFSFTVPLTRVAVGSGGLSPLFVGSGRAVLAALVAGLALALTRRRRPRGAQWLGVAIVAAGSVVGFPLLTSYALTRVPASHGAVVIALLPAATAVVAVLRTRERPGPAFWAAAAAGAAAAVGFAVIQNGGLGRWELADGLLFAAVAVCALAYAEGGLLARSLGSWQTISWALVLASPVMLALTAASLSTGDAGVGAATPLGWACVAYLGLVSAFGGFVAWYRGLAIGPLAQVSQVQLVQPLLSIAWAALFLREAVGPVTLLGGLVVVACALAAVRSRAGGSAAPAPSGPTLGPNPGQTLGPTLEAPRAGRTRP